MYIGVVIVTYNRLEKLKITLDLFDKQTRKPTYIIVVNNNSTDGTRDFLEQWSNATNTGYKREIVNLDKNLGGSGGFYHGLVQAEKEHAEWVWVSDDDAFPDKDAIECAYGYLSNNEDKINRISAICGKVLNFGNIDFYHRRSWVRGSFASKQIVSTKDDYDKNEFEINCFSYVGTIINISKMRQAGLTEKDYFIWYDDTEHSMRLSKVGKIICVPSITVYHDTGTTNDGLSWKTYYGCRNYILALKRHFPNIFYTELIILIIKAILCPIKGKKIQESRVRLCGIFDALRNKQGIHSVYKPGWKPE